jgi:hypothetical protein
LQYFVGIRNLLGTGRQLLFFLAAYQLGLIFQIQSLIFQTPEYLFSLIATYLSFHLGLFSIVLLVFFVVPLFLGYLCKVSDKKSKIQKCRQINFL